jgi:hypothetical protein
MCGRIFLPAAVLVDLVENIRQELATLVKIRYQYEERIFSARVQECAENIHQIECAVFTAAGYRYQVSYTKRNIWRFKSEIKHLICVTAGF